MGTTMAGLSAALAALQLDADTLALVTASSEQLVTASADQKELLDKLKDVGIAKMGARQKVARVFREHRPALEAAAEASGSEAAASEPAVAAPGAHASQAPPPPPTAGSTESFWANLIDANADNLSAGELGALQLDASQYAPPVRVLSRVDRLPSPLPPPPLPTSPTDSSAAAAMGRGGDGTAASNSETVTVYRERGNVAFGRQDYAAAERWYERVLALGAADGSGGMPADHAAALSNLAACALNREPADPAAAMRRLRPLLASCPRHVKGRLRAGRCCVMLGELHAAVGHYEVAFNVEKPRTPAEGLKLRWTAPMADVDPERRTIVGPDGKTPLSESAQAASDGKIHASRLLSHCERARSLAAAQRVDEALYLARAVCRACSHCTLGHCLLVGVLEGAGRLWEAQQEAEMALAERAAGAEDEELGVALARVLSKRGKTSEAEATLGGLARGRSANGDSRAARALRGLRAATKHKAEGNAAYAASDYVRAAAGYSRALEADVEGCLRPTLLGNRAQARLAEERYAEALADCHAALALDAGNVKLLLRRAAVHLALKDAVQARYDYAAVLKLEPSCQVARDFLERNDAARKAKERAEHADGNYAYGGGGGGGGSGCGYDEVDEPDEFDAYDLLGVARDANAAAIKSAYRKLALKWHPDKHADADEAEREQAEAMFQKVNLANSVLSDPVKKRMYDAGGRLKDVNK